jgi:hypothetical protein
MPVRSSSGPSVGAEAAFVLLAFLFVFGALDVVAVARNVFAHALVREAADEVDELDEAGAARIKGRQRPANG